MFLRIFKHLLPRGRAWRITADKNLRRFFQGLAAPSAEVKRFFDLIWDDISPATTRQLDEWDRQWGLARPGLTEQQRRDRLDATWKSPGGQDPHYIQNTLRANGFDVYVHDWWVPGTEAPIGVKRCAVARNPLVYLRPSTTARGTFMAAGEALAQAGESFAQAGNSTNPIGYPLVNLVTISTQGELLTLAGEAVAQAGEPKAQAGNYVAFRETQREYIVPTDPLKWPFFMYIGAEVFGQTATVESKRRDEFEALCLKICPSQLWIGVMVGYE